MAAKQKLTKAQHEELAAQLLGAHDAIADAWRKIMLSYPVNHPAYQAICKAGKALKTAQLKLESASADEGKETRYTSTTNVVFN